MKTFGQKVIEEQQIPPPRNPVPVQTFGQKLGSIRQQIGTRLNTPFHLGALRFQNSKLYYINVISPFGFRNLDPNEALERFLKYTSQLKNKQAGDEYATGMPSPITQGTYREHVDFTREYIEEATPKFYDLVKEETEEERQNRLRRIEGETPRERSNRLRRERRARRKAQQQPASLKKSDPDPSQDPYWVADVRRHQAPSPSPSKIPFKGTPKPLPIPASPPPIPKSGQSMQDILDPDDKNVIPLIPEKINELANIFRQNGIAIDFSRAKELLVGSDNIFDFLESMRQLFPEFMIQYRDGIVRKKIQKVRDKKQEYAVYIMSSQSQGKPQDQRNTSIDRKNIKMRVVSFLRQNDMSTAQPQAAIIFYNNISDFLQQISQFFVNDSGKEFLWLQFDVIKPYDRLPCQPFKKDGSINDFVCWVNVIENHITEAARNNVGTYPYMMLQEFIDAKGLRRRDDTFGDDGGDDAHVAAFSDSVDNTNTGVIEEAEKDQMFRSDPKQRESTGYQRLGRYQAGGEIITTPGRLPSAIGKGEEVYGLSHVTPSQMKRFHKDMIDWFITPGYLLYLTPQEWEKLQNRGGLVTNLAKNVINQIYQAGAAAPKVNL